MKAEAFNIFLPKYLSTESTNALREALKQFPSEYEADRFYSQKLIYDEIIYQGDGLGGFVAIDLPKTEAKVCDVLVLSNTCDMDPSNERLFEANILFTPLIKFSKYKSFLENKGVSKEKIESHLEAIRNQSITQIFYLPGFANFEEAIAFFDRTLNIRSDYADRSTVPLRRLFSLSNYGHYLLLLKISFHYCRFQDQIDRN